MSTPVYDVVALPYAVEMAAVTFGALSGALHATRKGSTRSASSSSR